MWSYLHPTALVFGRGLTFLNQPLFILQLGMTAETDLVTLCYALHQLLTSMLVALAETSLVSLLAETRLHSCLALDSEIARIHWVGLASSLLLLPLVLLLAWNSPAPTTLIKGVVLLGPAFVPALILSWTNAVSKAHHLSHQRLTPIAVSSVLEGVSGLAAIFVLARMIGPLSAPIGLYIGGLVAGLALFPRVLPAPNVLRMRRLLFRNRSLLATQLFGGALSNLNPVIDQSFASRLAVGSVAMYGFATRAFSAPVGLLMSGALPIFVGNLVSSRNSGHGEGALKKALKFCQWTLALNLGVALIAIPSYYLIGRGERLILFSSSTWREVAITAGILYIGLGSTAAVNVLGRVHIINGNRAVILRAGLLSFSSNLVADAVLANYFGIYGLAAASVVSSTMVGAYLFRTAQSLK